MEQNSWIKLSIGVERESGWVWTRDRDRRRKGRSDGMGWMREKNGMSLKWVLNFIEILGNKEDVLHEGVGIQSE